MRYIELLDYISSYLVPNEMCFFDNIIYVQVDPTFILRIRDIYCIASVIYHYEVSEPDIVDLKVWKQVMP